MIDLRPLDEVYDLDEMGFLRRHEDWDQEFPIRLGPTLGIEGPLTDEHWGVLLYIRERFQQTGECPLIYQVCRARGLRLSDLKRLFPSGYLRGACRLAGISYRDRIVNFWGEEKPARAREAARTPPKPAKTYEVDVQGFLVDPARWDVDFALHKAREMGREEDLTEEHWRVLRYIRSRVGETGAIPTVYETCEGLGLEIGELEGLFPRGYHRHAVKLAGHRAR